MAVGRRHQLRELLIVRSFSKPVGHQNIVAWQRAMDLAVAVYSLNRLLRANRQGDLASQLMRAAVSVPSNIAEGKGRSSQKDFAHFLSIALGSLREVETLVALLDRLGFAKAETVTELMRLADDTGRALYGLEQAVRSQKSPFIRPRRPTPRSDSDVQP